MSNATRGYSGGHEGLSATMEWMSNLQQHVEYKRSGESDSVYVIYKVTHVRLMALFVLS